MERQVLSIEQMQHLKEQGIDTSKASMHYWVITNGEYSKEMGGYVFSKEPSCIILKLYPYEFISDAAIRRVEDIPTLTLQDILEMLPNEIKEDSECNILSITKYNDGWYIRYGLSDEFVPLISFESNSLLDAAYEMLCWCIENGYIKKSK